MPESAWCLGLTVNVPMVTCIDGGWEVVQPLGGRSCLEEGRLPILFLFPDPPRCEQAAFTPAAAAATAKSYAHAMYSRL